MTHFFNLHFYYPWGVWEQNSLCSHSKKCPMWVVQPFFVSHFGFLGTQKLGVGEIQRTFSHRKKMSHRYKLGIIGKGMNYHKNPIIPIIQLGNVKRLNFCNKFSVILQYDPSLFSLLFSYSKRPCNFQWHKWVLKYSLVSIIPLVFQLHYLIIDFTVCIV